MANAQPARTLSVDRRQLLCSVAAITVTGVAPIVGQPETNKPAEVVNAVKPPPAEVLILNVCATTRCRLEEIAQPREARP
jgi:hypothetical protein